MLAATVASCSDWNDWNSVQSDMNMTAEKSLLENINENPNLQNFKKILDATGMQQTLEAKKYYTIWAPQLTNAQLDSVMALDSATIVDQFINNHIAEYNHQASGIIDERIHTLNEKSYSFTGENGIYQFNNVEIVGKNIPSNNGTLHILKSNSPFLPNAYQSLWVTDGIDSIANYFKMYELTYLDESKSKAGPMVNGKQTYIDSVMVTYNSMSNSIHARLDSEDSLYTFLLPNNDAYKKLYDKISSLYKYADGTKAQDVANAKSTTYATLTAPSMDMSYLKDSLIRRQIVNNLAFSHTDKYNANFFDGKPYPYKGNGEPADTIYSTYRNKFSEPEQIFLPEHIVETIRLSNGEGIVVDSLMFKSWETFFPERKILGTDAIRTLTSERTNITVAYPDSSKVDLTDGTKLTYVQATPSSNFAKPEVDFYLDNVLSGTYRIYAVIPPADIDITTDSTTVVNPNWLNFTLNYYDSKTSKLVDYAFTNERYEVGKDTIITYSDKGAEVRTIAKNTDFFNNTARVDTMLLGEVTFPCCYAGIGAYYPNIKVTIPATFSTLASRGHTKAFDRTIRICAIIMRPVEYDKYLKDEE